jgi:hypothetical protein
MSLLAIFIANQGIRLLTQVGSEYLKDAQEAEKITKELLPVVSAAIKKETSSKQGLQSFLDKADHIGIDKYIADPASTALSTVASAGEDVVQNILGITDSKAAIVAHLAARTGLNALAVSQLLPVVAMLAVGGLAKQISPEERSNLMAAAEPKKSLFGFFGRLVGKPRTTHYGAVVLGKMMESGVDHEEQWVQDAFET